jgi:hypothetical protein
MGQRVWQEKACRALKKDGELRRNIFTASQMAHVMTPEGLYVGRRPVHHVNWQLINPIGEKLAKGLYFFEYGTPLPPAISVDFVPQDLVLGSPDLKGYLDLTLNGKHSWPGTFEYRHRKIDEQPNMTLWMFLFFGRRAFVVFTGRKEFEIKAKAH